ncbi:hypothetical protein [Streptomyces antarcticus]|nr:MULTISPECIES: hypothetical protein [unclassified Streptomyces]MCY0944831.1 hypothetical protein [Streptomyces sp. H34-AA3]MCZ4081136.1 hypothetical protein [Streptomyces sp. H34-S5]
MSRTLPPIRHQPIVIGATVERLGWADENGRFDEQKMRESVGE